MRAPVSVRLTPDAAAVLTKWRARLEPRRRPSGDLGQIQGWAAKLDGTTVRIAALLHLAAHVGADELVSAATMEGAVQVGMYLIAHARAVFGYVRADERLDGALRVIDWINAKRLTAFSRRDCHRAHQASFRSVGDIDPILGLLTQHGYIRPHDREPSIGRPSPRFDVNPRLTERTKLTEPEREAAFGVDAPRAGVYGSDRSAATAGPSVSLNQGGLVADAMRIIGDDLEYGGLA